MRMRSEMDANACFQSHSDGKERAGRHIGQQNRSGRLHEIMHQFRFWCLLSQSEFARTVWIDGFHCVANGSRL